MPRRAPAQTCVPGSAHRLGACALGSAWPGLGLRRAPAHPIGRGPGARAGPPAGRAGGTAAVAPGRWPPRLAVRVSQGGQGPRRRPPAGVLPAPRTWQGQAPHPVERSTTRSPNDAWGAGTPAGDAL